MQETIYYIYHVPGIKIGCTKQLQIRMRVQGFTSFEVLETHTDIFEASRRERELQKEYGYKVDICFYYSHKNEASLEKISKSNKGRLFSEKTKQRMSAAHKGIKQKDEVKNKISNTLKGISRSDETKRKMSEVKKGKVFTEEHKKKMSEAAKRRCEKRRLGL